MNKALTNEQKREMAQILYVSERLTAKEISARGYGSERSIGKWKEEGKWDDLRQSLLITKEVQLRRLYAQIDWVTKQIEDRAAKVATPQESDTISKLTSSIRKLETETSIAEVFEIGKQFVAYVRQDDLETAKLIVRYYDGFLQSKLK